MKKLCYYKPDNVRLEVINELLVSAGGILVGMPTDYPCYCYIDTDDNYIKYSKTLPEGYELILLVDSNNDKGYEFVVLPDVEEPVTKKDIQDAINNSDRLIDGYTFKTPITSVLTIIQVKREKILNWRKLIDEEEKNIDELLKNCYKKLL